MQYRHQEPESSWHRSSLQRQNVNRDSFQKLFNDNYHHNSLVIEHHSSASQDRLKLSLPEILERQRQHQQWLAIAKQREAEARRQAELESKQQQSRELVDELISTTVEPTTVTEVVSNEVTADSSTNLSENSMEHSPKAQDSKDEFEEGYNDESRVQSSEDNSSTSANISNHQQLESLEEINVEVDNVEFGNTEEAVELVSLDANKAPMDRVTDDLAVNDTLKEVSELKETNNRKEIRGVEVQELEVIKELENLKINRGTENLLNSEELGTNFNNSKNSRNSSNSDNPHDITAQEDSNIEVLNLRKLRTIELSQVQADP